MPQRREVVAELKDVLPLLGGQDRLRVGERGEVRFELADADERIVPPDFEFAGDQAVVWRGPDIDDREDPLMLELPETGRFRNARTDGDVHSAHGAGVRRFSDRAERRTAQAGEKLKQADQPRRSRAMAARTAAGSASPAPSPNTLRTTAGVTTAGVLAPGGRRRTISPADRRQLLAKPGHPRLVRVGTDEQADRFFLLKATRGGDGDGRMTITGVGRAVRGTGAPESVLIVALLAPGRGDRHDRECRPDAGGTAGTLRPRDRPQLPAGDARPEARLPGASLPLLDQIVQVGPALSSAPDALAEQPPELGDHRRPAKRAGRPEARVQLRINGDRDLGQLTRSRRRGGCRCRWSSGDALHLLSMSMLLAHCGQSVARRGRPISPRPIGATAMTSDTE